MSKESKRSAREALAAERARQAAADKRRQRIINTAIIIVVVLVVGGIFIAVQKNRSTGTTTGALPQGVTEKGGPLVFGSGPVKVDVYEDFQCPNCKDFEAVNGKYLKQQVDSNAITLSIRLPPTRSPARTRPGRRRRWPSTRSSTSTSPRRPTPASPSSR